MQFVKGVEMSIDPHLSDKAILADIGHRLGRRRVELELTQADLAGQAGISKRTVERIEAGESVQTTNLIRILRVVELLETLDAAIPAVGPRPMDLLKLRGKERQRASSKKRNKESGDEWIWGDES
jgi:transcriptional regulator with XRE-family HTH domain